METISGKTKSLFFFSLILSLSIHVLLFGILTIQFPIQPHAFKPNFIFFGSILRKGDFPAESLNYKDSLHKTDQTQIHSIKIQKLSPEPYRSDVFKKPVSQTESIHSKQNMKTVFELEPLGGDTNEAKEKFDIGVEQDLTPYKPLRIRKQ